MNKLSTILFSLSSLTLFSLNAAVNEYSEAGVMSINDINQPVSQTNKFNPDVNQYNFAGVQIYSFQGLVNTFIGYRNNKHFSTLGIGYTPELENHDELTVYTVKYFYRTDIQYKYLLYGKAVTLYPLSIGATVIYGDDEHLFASLPDKYPDDYYLPTAFRYLLNIRSSIELNKNTTFYAELSFLEIAVREVFRNVDFFIEDDGFVAATSIGVGFSFRL